MITAEQITTWPMKTKALALLLAGMSAAALGGCGRDTEALPVEPPSQRPTASTASSAPTPVTASTPGTARPDSSQPTNPASTASTTSTSSRTLPTSSSTAPVRTSRPSAITTTTQAGPGAGNPDITTVPQPAGWSPAPITQEQDPVNAGKSNRTRPPAQAATEALVTGCREASSAPAPRSATELHVARDGRPGVGLILTFDSSQQAASYLAALQTQLRACPATSPSDGVPGVTELVGTNQTWLGRRDYGADQQWTEIIVTNNNQLRLWILLDPGHQISRAEIDRYATALQS